MENLAIIWAVILIVAALLLFFIELFLPSGGLFGLMAGAALVAGIVMLFYQNTTLGLIGTIASLLALPFVIALGFKLLPHTPVFRLLTLSDRQQASPTAGGEHGDGPHGITAGDRGKALTELRPVGTCQIEGKRLDCLAEHGIIQPGTPVRVVWADGMQVKVRADDA